MSPEVFFNNDANPVNSTAKLLKQLNTDTKIFNPTIYLESININSLTKHNKLVLKKLQIEIEKGRKINETILILFVGSPASTKSYFYTTHFQDLIKGSSNWVYMNNDTFNGTPAKFNKQIGESIRQGSNVIIDNTTPTKLVRSKIITIARDNKIGKIIAIHFDIEKQVVFHLNEIRNKMITVKLLNSKANPSSMNDNDDENCNLDDGHTNKTIKNKVPVVAINTYWKKYDPVIIEDENIDMLFEYKFIPFDKIDTNSLYHKAFNQFNA
jgi:predicted kinase